VSLIIKNGFFMASNTMISERLFFIHLSLGFIKDGKPILLP